jgi:hypothetical protein
MSEAAACMQGSCAKHECRRRTHSGIFVNAMKVARWHFCATKAILSAVTIWLQVVMKAVAAEVTKYWPVHACCTWMYVRSIFNHREVTPSIFF